MQPPRWLSGPLSYLLPASRPSPPPHQGREQPSSRSRQIPASLLNAVVRLKPAVAASQPPAGGAPAPTASSPSASAADERSGGDDKGGEGGGALPPPMVPPPTDPLQPLQWEAFLKEWSQMTQQDTFDGFRLEAQKNVTKNLQSCHSLFLGTTMRPEGYIYQFGPTFTTEDQSLFLLGRLGTDGTLNARGVKKFFGTTEAKVTATSNLKDEQRNMLEAGLDHAGKDWTSSLKLAWQGTWIVNGSYTQLISKYLQMGGELTWVSANGASIGAVGGRYFDGTHAVSAQLVRQPEFAKGQVDKNAHALKLNFVRKVTDRLSLGAEFEYSHPDAESALRLAYEYNFRQARIQGLLDTCGKVSVFVQDFTGFGVSGLIDYWQGIYKFGFMMHVVPPPEGAQQPGGGPPAPSGGT
ncbi:unnamed protein product [Vitrella brassicaformis CCMP3155]|uniref:Mitochondrial import receptor subunit TOM40 n=1 Tax=Vitrella brassicaformis (strain CCMP3155) TaxID=1169540 RepID=A0A0G4H700_VITBC|nr:unnamed protein product [Vitrella brassicaformis CCMP3155]|eukprot:CEM39652.1 unnamed protein product [Vitrella brassicaformis CCMP3155]